VPRILSQKASKIKQSQSSASDVPKEEEEEEEEKKSEEEVLADALMSEFPNQEDPDDILADVMAGLDDTLLEANPEKEVSLTETMVQNGNDAKEGQKEKETYVEVTDANIQAMANTEPEALEEDDEGEMVGGYGEQASVDEIKALAAKQALERAERKAKLDEKKKKKTTAGSPGSEMRRTQTAPTTGTSASKNMADRLKSETVKGHQLVRQSAALPTVKLSNLLPVVWVVLAAGLLGWAGTVDPIANTLSVEISLPSLYLLI